MAFVPILGLGAPRTTTFTGRAVTAHPSTVASSPAFATTPVARLGTNLGNSSLDKLGLERFAERHVLNDTEGEQGATDNYEVIILACYRQIFANAYIMESERAEMAKAESCFRNGDLTVKEFCRVLCKTYQYRKRFFDGRPLYGAIELCFKHILGRTPDGLEQYRAKSAVYDTKGYEAFIDAYFDCGEYDTFFDEWCVPYYRGHLTTSNLSMAAFTHLFQVVRGASTSDKANPRTLTNKITLNRAGIQSIPLAIIAPGAPGAIFQDPDASSGSWQNGFSGLTMARTSHGDRDKRGKMFRIEVSGYNQAKANNGRPGVQLRTRSGKFYKGANNSSNSKFSSFRRSNNVYLVPFDELSDTYVKIHKNGGIIASITPVS